MTVYESNQVPGKPTTYNMNKGIKRGWFTDLFGNVNKNVIKLLLAFLKFAIFVQFTQDWSISAEPDIKNLV